MLEEEGWPNRPLDWERVLMESFPVQTELDNILCDTVLDVPRFVVPCEVKDDSPILERVKRLVIHASFRVAHL